MGKRHWTAGAAGGLIALLLCAAVSVPAQGAGWPAQVVSERPVAAAPDPANQPLVKPSVPAGAAVLMDWRTGAVLYAKQADQRRDPASTTKVLTAILALERGNLNDRVQISRRAAGTPGSRMHLRAGEVYSLHDLLYGLLLRSGNDAAVAIAEHLAGSVEEFARWMNEKARAIGAKNSHFTNPHGLTEPDHYSTAYDLAVITRYALQNPVFRSVVAVKQAPITFEYLNRDVILHNTNQLLHSLPGADGVKTGTTAAAGQCLIASATREEQKLIAVVLHAGNRWAESSRLLEWGFSHFRLAFVGRQGEVLKRLPLRDGKLESLPVVLADDLPLVIGRKEEAPSRPELELVPDLRAPIARGQTVGKAVVRHGGKVVAKADLIAAEEVPRASWIDLLYRKIRPMVQWMHR
jgi:D-alanyl-D-alanine carboxypeptidase (penicillin-binding protein 5/6)